MDRIMTQFYDGYEGEPEIQFIKGSNEGKRTIVSIWDGYFDDIMSQLKPTALGWQGLAYYYHLGLGWEDGELWEIPENQSALKEFQNVDTQGLRFSNSKEVLALLCDLLTSAIQEKEKVIIDKN